MEVEFQGSYVGVKVQQRYVTDKPPVRAKRGKITKFTAASRRRLMDKLNRLDWSSPVAFCTTTYGQVWPSPAVFKNHVRVFGQRLQRIGLRIVDEAEYLSEMWQGEYNLSGIWKMEPQKRGAPHAHFFIFGLPGMSQEQLRWLIAWTWALVVGEQYWDKSDPFCWKVPMCDAQWLTSKKDAIGYAAKYMAKDAEFSTPDFVERYKLPGENSSAPEEKLPILAYGGTDVLVQDMLSLGAEVRQDEDEGAFGEPLDKVSYSHDDDDEEMSVGRFWGVFGRKFLPFAEALTVVVDGTVEAVEYVFHEFRRTANNFLKSQWRSRPKKRRRRLHNVTYGRWKSFKLYVGDVREWFVLLQSLIRLE